MSIWNKKEIKTKKETLKSDIEVDVLIIGAGITGMTTAYYLRNNKNICVVDASKIGHGVTLNTTAKINYFQEKIYTKIAKQVNKETAIKYLKSERYAINSIKKIIKEESIDCDFKRVPSFVFANKQSEVEPLKKEVDFLKEQGIKVYEKDLPSKITSYKSYCVKDTYIFNPIKYLQGIYNKIESNMHIYENTKIIKIEKLWTHFNCYTPKYKIKAKKVVIACHYPYFTIPFYLPIKSYIEKSYIIVSKVEKDLNFTCISSSNPIYSCRFYKDNDTIYQISLAESHNTAFKQNDSYHFNRVKEIFNLNSKDIVMSYTNTDIMTTDSLPYIGKLKTNMYISCGYNTWGMTNGILGAKIMSDMILNRYNRYASIFNPTRFNKSNIKELPYIIFSQTKSFLGPKLVKNKTWYKNVTFTNEHNKSLATYTDKNNVKHTIINKCPHLGCSLIFNEKEKTWECPCHSSRFTVDGKCIKGPSVYDISYKK